MNTIRYAKYIYYDKKREWNKIIDRAMAVDFLLEQLPRRSTRSCMTG